MKYKREKKEKYTKYLRTYEGRYDGDYTNQDNG